MDKQSRKWSRIDFVGQNGNTGEHYMEQMELFTYCPVKCNTKECDKHYTKAPYSYDVGHPVYWMLDKSVDCEQYAPCTD